MGGEPQGHDGALELSPWELAAGTAIGEDPAVPALPPTGPETPGTALAEAVLGALRRPPCVVSFSGGRDSSAILAAATDVADRHGLALPVPVSLRFPGVASTEESQWQELVVSHLKLPEWERIELRDEVDFLGEIARRALRTHGLLWPANAHFHSPIFARAAGGSVLTGVDGDGLLGWRFGRLRAALRGPTAPRPRILLRAAVTLLPQPARALRYQRQPLPHITWLRRGAERVVQRLSASEAASEPIRWDRRVDWYSRRRYLRLGVHSLGLLGADHDVRVVHPFLDRRFLTSLATAGGRAGYGTRERAMRALFAGLLPGALISRPAKAEFGRALWGPDARAFTASWDGTGVDPELVDGDALRAVWTRENPPLGAATLMQSAWLQRLHDTA
jgi:asparagine synthase